jgi:hypothetical protein
LAQKDAFLEEILCLSKGKALSISSNFRCLYPFLDIEGLVRVDGRLKNTPFSEDRKHPILLPKRDRLTELIIK